MSLCNVEHGRAQGLSEDKRTHDAPVAINRLKFTFCF